MRYAYLVVEGPHDVEFVGRLLKPHGFKRVRPYEELDPYWDDLVPKSFPPYGRDKKRDLTSRVPVPTFFSSVAASVAVHAAGGDSEIVNRVEETLLVPLASPPDAIGVLLDADSVESPDARFNAIRAALAKKTSLALPTKPGEVSMASPSCGIFVLPDNQSRGTLEDLLIEGASIHYSSLLLDAQALVSGAQAGRHFLAPDDMRELNKPAGPKKAAVACVATSEDQCCQPVPPAVARSRPDGMTRTPSAVPQEL
jgi:hypothetical protein